MRSILRSPGRPWLGAVLAMGALALAGCGLGSRAAPRTFVWISGHPAPSFDPAGPPEPVRAALLRLLGRGLVEEDSAGRVRPAAAESITVASDGLQYTFRLPARLAFVDGTPCRSDDFRAALVNGLTRTDHATRAWLLGAVRGVEKVRPGQRTAPEVGIETPDPRTLVVHLTRPDSLLLRKLALPGVSMPWRGAAADSERWGGAVGLGPYRVSREEPGRLLVLARAGGPRSPWSAAPESVTVRFVPGAPRALAQLRAGGADLLWPVPPGLAEYPLPAGYGLVERAATPTRTLLLVMRPDRPPTAKLEARLALAHAVNREELVHALGDSLPGPPWLTGAPPFQFPPFDPDQVRVMLARGEFGRSLQVLMSYDADGPAAGVASLLQGQWAGQGLYIALSALRGARLEAELLAGGSHLLLVEHQPLLDDLSAQLAAIVMPARGPGVGCFRTMWRTREFDPWIAARPAPRPPVRRGAHGAAGSGAAASAVAETPVPAGATAPGDLAARLQQRLAEEMVALPLARLPWRWIERGGPLPVGFHPHYGPQCLADSVRLGANH